MSSFPALYRAARPLAVVCFTLAIAGCGGAGSSGASDSTGGGGSSAFNAGSVPYAAVELDFQTGTLPAGSVVPLACVDGGTVWDAHVPFCDVRHLHDTIDIVDIGSGFTDPASGNCGHGRVADFTASRLDHTCPAVDDARLSIIVDDLTRYSSVFAALLEPGGSELVLDLTTGLFTGANPVEASANGNYVSAAIFARCALGTNPDTMENEVQHSKVVVDLTDGVQRYVKLECAPHARVTANLDIELANSEYSGGEFWTGGRRTSSQGLTAGITNSLSFDVDEAETEKTGLAIGYKLSGVWDAYAFTYSTEVTDTIQADATTLEPMTDTAVDDAPYLGADYQGLRIYAKAPGLYQHYFALDGSTPSDREVPTVYNLGDVGGIHKLQARFEATESGTNRTQTTRISQYAVNPGASMSFSQSRPPFFTDADYYVTPEINGFYFGASYDPGAGSLGDVRYTLRAETFDAASSTRHKWRVDNFSADLSGTYVTWPDDYVNSTGTSAVLPGGSDLTRIRYQAASDPDAMRDHLLYEDRPLEDLDGVLDLRIGYQF